MILGLGGSHLLLSNCAQEPQLLSPSPRAVTATRYNHVPSELVLCTQRRRCNEQPMHCREESPPLTAWREPVCGNQCNQE